MKILAFDLSTTCTGVAYAEIVDNIVTTVITEKIQPKNPSPADFGFLKTKRKITLRSGEVISAYVKHKDEIVTKTERNKRNYLVRKSSEEFRLDTTVHSLNTLIVDVYKPDLILMEANMAFRNIDTTRQLAEVSGALQAVATTNNITLDKINVNTARAFWNVSRECIKFSKTLSPQELSKIKDLTKETLKYLVLDVFNGYKLNKTMSTDESDALVLLHYYIVKNNIKLR